VPETRQKVKQNAPRKKERPNLRKTETLILSRDQTTTGEKEGWERVAATLATLVTNSKAKDRG